MEDSTSKSIPLREWVERALATADVSSLANESFTSSFGADPSSWPADIRKSLAVLSNGYLSSALKVARSLADQICQAEEHDGCQWLSRAPSSNWADRVAIHLSAERPSVEAYEGDLQPLPFVPQNPSTDSRELQAMLNSLIPDQSVFTKDDKDVNCINGPRESIVSYHSVTRAEILPSPEDTNCNPSNKMQQIYSLGIVFYELFSGGEMNPDIPPQFGAKKQNTNNMLHTNEGDICKPPRPLDQAGTFFDFAGELNILDDNDSAGDQVKHVNDSQFTDDIEELMPNKKKGPQNNKCSTTPSVSVELLKLKGLPVALCDLIGNMIDCINGDLSGEEAYRNISDVRSDLQLMLDKPSRFLYDIDIETLSVTGLQLNEAVFGRENDFSTLQNSYRRSVSGEHEPGIGIIVGPSGVGKSVLAHRLGGYISSTGGLFLSGKFDQVQQAKPFSAIASAFNEYCVKISNEKGTSRLQEVASKLRIALGAEAHHLVKMIPNLSIILGEHAGDFDEDQDCVAAQKRIHYLLYRFIDVISSFSGAPVTLFLDDLQWADPSSLSAINQVLMIRSSTTKRQFFFLGSCREEGLLQEHPFGNMLSKICHFGVHTTEVTLACMDKDMTNTLLSESLSLSPRLTWTLSELIHHKTKGNPLFFSQMMISLCKDGLVWLSLSRRRWVWDEEKIQSRKLPDDVAAFLTATIGKLPKDVQNALCTLSCFGARSDYALIKALEVGLGFPLVEPLDSAFAEGLLDKANGSYSFSHDRLEEAAYTMIRADERCLLHFKYGVALASLSFDFQDDDMLFIAASQINRGGPAAVEDAVQAVSLANLNLITGQKAMEMSDFSSAYSFFDNGISFLRKRHWQEHYNLSLQLFESASKCALVAGDIVSLKLLSEQVYTFAQSLEDKMNAMFNVVSALSYASQLPESVNETILVLSQLGEELPESLSEPQIMLQIEKTKAILEGFSDQELIEYKRMDDPLKIMAMKFYARLEPSLQQIKPDAQPSITLKMVQLSIAHGMSPMSPIGFTHFGQLLVRLGNVKEGCRCVKIAQRLLDKIGSKEVAGEVIAVGTQIMCFVEPVQATLESYVQGQANALAAGDTHGAMFNIGFYVGTSFWSGMKLPVCRERYARAHKLMEEHKHFTWLAHIIHMETNVLTLMGEQEDTAQSSGSNGTEIQLGEDFRKENQHASMTYYFQKMYISFMLREYDQMKDCAEQYFEYNLRSWAILYIFTAETYVSGLVSFWIYRQSNDPKWAERGCKAVFAMKKWAESSEHNFQQNAYLLEAEQAFSNNDIENAEALYEKAISASRRHRFINTEALACELAGHFYTKTEKHDKAIQYFMQAHEKYHEWGAVAKSNALFEFVQRVLGPSSSISDSLPDSLYSTPSTHQNGHGDKKVRKRE